MTDQNTKHPNYEDRLLPKNDDIFKPEFKRDSRGRYFMQLPGYGKWMVGNEPGSKIIAQGSEDERGGPATDPGSIRTGSLSVETTIYVGDKIALDGGTGCIYVGEFAVDGGTYIAMCPGGLQGYSNKDVVFGFFMAEQTWNWRAGEKAAKGDVLIGGIDSGEYVYWNDDESKLYIKGDLIIEGDLQSLNFVTGVSGWRLGYYDDTAEFQDVWVRGQVNMESGSSGSADYIAETLSKRWAGETGADITNNHTSNNTDNVDFATALNTATGADRGLNAINAFYRYGTWLNSPEMDSMGSDPASGDTAVRMDNGGIYGWRTAAATPSGESRRTFWLDANTGDLMLRGTVFASAGAIGGWIVDADRIWKEVYSSPNYTKLELNVREDPGIDMHIQAFTDTNSSYTSPTGIQITPGTSTSPDPRLDIYDNGTRRVTLNTTGLRFYASNGTTVTSQILMGTGVSDVSFGGGVVRCWSSGVRVSTGNAFAAQASGSTYLQMYGSGGAGILEIPSNSYGLKIMNSNSSANIMTFTTSQIYCYENFMPRYNNSYRLGGSSNNWDVGYIRSLSYSGTMYAYFATSFRMVDSGTSIWTFYRSGSDAYMGSSLNNAKIHASNNITLDTSGTIWLVCAALSKPAGSFTIDHPLKPDTHFLQHSFVESPEMMNLYRGQGKIVSGKCSMTMPDWFIALNGEDQSEFSYYLTAIGGQNDLWVEAEMDDTGTVKFGGANDGKFSYLIAAVRNDPFAKNHRIKLEPTKKEMDKEGEYIYPGYYAHVRSFTGDAWLDEAPPVID